ncbi:MAG: NUDIX hydrolase [Fimbriimonadaceae bacterium]|nr:NUDIX hydrolase [Fimbriimonadaceae bacterium]
MKRVAQREVYRNKWLTFYEDAIERGNGTPGIYSWADKPPCAIIIPYDGNSLTLIRQYRYPIQQWSLEFPMGAVEGEPGLTPEKIARQELREETGLLAGTLTELGSFYLACGVLNQIASVWLAESLVPTERAPELEESDLTVHTMTVPEFDACLRKGEIIDGPTLTAYWMWQSRRALDRGPRTD